MITSPNLLPPLQLSPPQPKPSLSCVS
jgi:hypothetical protein